MMTMELYKKGSRGAMVRKIQQAVGCYPDGIFGSLTEEAVMAWQRDNGLTADGIVGARTLAVMFSRIVGLRKSRREITDIVVHCTASREGVPLTVEDIRRIHMANGWSDIGYHYVIDLDGNRHPGRDVDISGAHVSGHNAHSIGVVYVGGLDKDGNPKDTRTEAQKAALLLLLMDLRKLYPKARIRGHRDFSRDLNGNGIIEPREWVKACPCFDAATEYSQSFDKPSTEGYEERNIYCACPAAGGIGAAEHLAVQDEGISCTDGHGGDGEVGHGA